MTHYGFAPGPTPQDGRLRELFHRLQDTKLEHRPTLQTLRGFIDHLVVDNSVTKPIDNVYLGSHANGFQLHLPLFAGQTDRSNYEAVEQTLIDSSKSVEFPESLFSSDPSTRTFIHFKGCSVGKSQPFMDKLSEALGAVYTLTAPKHFHGIDNFPSAGAFEFMEYEFKVFTHPDQVPQNKAELVALFQSAARQAEQRQDPSEFLLIDGSYVPSASFEQWVPLQIKRDNTVPRRYPLQFAPQEQIGKLKTLDRPTRYLVRSSLPETFSIDDSESPFPTGHADRLEKLEEAMLSAPNYQAGHPFPMYRRVGYQSLADYVQGYKWSFKREASTGLMTASGVRREFELRVPITSGGNIVFNFHPLAGTNHSRIIRMLENNPVFFGIA